AGAAEALPHRLGSRLLHRADRLPLVLEPLDLVGGGVSVDRVLERLDFCAERVFFREVLRPHRLALGEVGVAAGEKAVAGGAEALPDRLLLAAADRTDRL